MLQACIAGESSRTRPPIICAIGRAAFCRPETRSRTCEPSGFCTAALPETFAYCSAAGSFFRRSIWLAINGRIVPHVIHHLRPRNEKTLCHLSAKTMARGWSHLISLVPKFGLPPGQFPATELNFSPPWDRGLTGGLPSA